jgi:hypothetical protein
MVEVMVTHLLQVQVKVIMVEVVKSQETYHQEAVVEQVLLEEQVVVMLLVMVEQGQPLQYQVHL